VRNLLERDPRLWLSVSATTRPRREGDVDGRDYLFLDRQEFERKRDHGEFLEWFDVYGDLYGTPRAPVEERLAAGGDVLLEIDVQGALTVKKEYPGSVLVFVKAPSREEQRRRLLERGQDDPAVVERRLARADAEEAAANRFDHVVVNDDVDRAGGEVAAILAGHRGESPPP
jgi:guanylate kinase